MLRWKYLTHLTSFFMKKQTNVPILYFLRILCVIIKSVIRKRELNPNLPSQKFNSQAPQGYGIIIA